MNTPIGALHSLVLCLYFTSAVIFLLEFIRRDRSLFSHARTMLVLGFAALTAEAVLRGFAFGYLPLLTFHETLLFLAWVITAVMLLMDRVYRLRAAYFLAVPLLFPVLFLSAFFDMGMVEPGADLAGPWLTGHIAAVIMAYGTFAVAFIISVMYLLADYSLKRKKFATLIMNLPSLDTMDHYIYRLVTAGFFLLTVSIFLGAFWANSVWGAYWRWDPKEIWSVLTWTVYAVYLHIRLFSGWQGRKVAMMNSLGFATLVFNYVFVRFMLPGSLHRFF